MAKQEKTWPVMDEPEAERGPLRGRLGPFKEEFLFTCEPPDSNRGRSG